MATAATVEQLRARWDALVARGEEEEIPADRLLRANAGTPCGCSYGWFGPDVDPRNVNPSIMDETLVMAWAADLRRAAAGEDVRGLYGWGVRLCAEHRRVAVADDLEVQIASTYQRRQAARSC